MPVSLTYPGVYVEEIPSGVRTITGVSTSITAFLGNAKRGPINCAVRILGYSDFERRFGGLSADSEMSYAVRQFFLNGGSDAWVVRLAANASPASRKLLDSSSAFVIEVTAIDEGQSGNNIEVRIDYKSGNPASTFNLSLNYESSDNPADNKRETFVELSMNSKNSRYVENIVNGSSQLVTIKRIASSAVLALVAGTSLSGDLTESGTLVDVTTKIDSTHDQFRVSINGSSPVNVQIAPTDIVGGTNTDRLKSLCDKITSKVLANVGSNPLLTGFTCKPDGNRIKMISGVSGESSNVQVLPGIRNDLSGRLKLGILNGGTETEAAAILRPVEIPDHGTFSSGTFGSTDLDTMPDGTHRAFQISLDGYGMETVDIGDTNAAGTILAEHLADIAERIQTAVRAVKPSNPAYRDFTAKVIGGNQLVLASGTSGFGSSVIVGNAAPKSIFTGLHFDKGTSTQPQNTMLQYGTESPITDSTAYNTYIGDRSTRKGIYALEAVDIFNILCLPAVSDAGILMDAASYCEERRAFMIVDPPKELTPAQMSKTLAGTSLPKSDHAAVYYPWIQVADPLNGGKLRTTAPGGTMAGLYSRTDSSRGVWKAPAGTDATLNGVQAVDYLLTNGENGTLNPAGVNCLRIFPVYGSVAWGARTLKGSDAQADEYKYIPVRRLALYIEESLYRGTQWVVFEPNDEPLWSQVRLNLGAFMHNLFIQGAFQGKTPKEAYFVKCDRETTTQNHINQGIVNIMVGFAPLKPAEFVIIKLQQMAGQIQA